MMNVLASRRWLLVVVCLAWPGVVAAHGAYLFLEDRDGDGTDDFSDNCIRTANADQANEDGDAWGDVCDLCVSDDEAEMTDSDSDGLGDRCDPDRDGDGIPNASDNCPDLPNFAQTDTDGDGLGDRCDDDDDGDGLPDASDACRLIFGEPTDPGCEDDADGDGVAASVDTCPGTYDPDQDDLDGDGLGDVCDPDIDGDGIGNSADNCPRVANPEQVDLDGDGLGDGGDWGTGADSCDDHECYVYGRTPETCLSPDDPFEVALFAPYGAQQAPFQETEILVFTNRLHADHSWSARLESWPEGSSAVLENRSVSGAVVDRNWVSVCGREDSNGCADYRTIYMFPDYLGAYEIVVEVTTETGDRDEETIIISVEGEDFDGDGISDDFDSDADGDGVLDFEDLDPRDPTVGLPESRSSKHSESGGCAASGVALGYVLGFGLAFRRPRRLKESRCR